MIDPVKELTPLQAWDLLQQRPDAALIDVRTTVEFLYVGHPAQALHVPWQEAPGWEVDREAFVTQVRAALRERSGAKIAPEDLPAMTICRSGKRSLAAAQAMQEAGFKEVYNVAEGFEGDLDGRKHRGTINGWRYHGLPWEQT